MVEGRAFWDQAPKQLLGGYLQVRSSVLHLSVNCQESDSALENCPRTNGSVGGVCWWWLSGWVVCVDGIRDYQ